MSEHTPGPFTKERDSRWVRRDGCHVATLQYGLTQSGQNELVSLLNKGTHFEAMREALAGAKDVFLSISNDCADRGVPMPKASVANVVVNKIEAALAAAAGEEG